MNRYLTYILCICLTLLPLVSCQEQEDVQPVPEWVDLSISAAMATRADFDEDANVVKEYELMHTLRIIIFDQSNNIEHNELFEFEEGVFEASEQIFKVKKDETKTIYLLANCESILQNEEISINNLDNVELKTAEGWFSGQPQAEGFLLPATAKYSIHVGDVNQTEDLWIAHAANKISFEFTNESEEEVTISEWRLTPIAQNSYLIPHITGENENTPEEDRWYSKVLAQYNNADLNGDDEGVTNYNVPDDADQDTFNEELDEKIKIAAGENATLYSATEPFYLHESEADSDPTTGQQQYTVSCVINDRVYDAVLPNLPSLFRGTYIKIKATIKQLENGEGQNPFGIIIDWQEGDEVEGELESEEDRQNP